MGVATIAAPTSSDPDDWGAVDYEVSGLFAAAPARLGQVFGFPIVRYNAINQV